MSPIYKPPRHHHIKPKLCPYCLKNKSIGWTVWGMLGCSPCQEGVDKYINETYKVIKVEYAQ